MAVVGSVEVEIVANDAPARSKLNGFMGFLEGFGRAAAGAAAGIGLALGITEIVQAMQNAVKTGIQYNAMIEQSGVAWRNMTKNAKEASLIMSELQRIATNTPFEFESLDKATRMLYMAGFRGREALTAITALGDAVAYAGRGREELEGLALAIMQISAKGKISAEEMSQFAERSIDGWGILAQQMGMTKREVMDLSAKGKLMAEDALPKLIKGMQQAFGGSMQKQSQTFNGQMSTLKDTWKQLTAELAKPVFDKLKVALPGLIALLNGLRQAAQGNMGGFRSSLDQAFGTERAQQFINILNQMKAPFQSIQSSVSSLQSTWQGLFSAIQPAISSIISSLPGLFAGMIAAISGIANMIAPVILPIIQSASSFIVSLINQIKQFWAQNGAMIMQAWNQIKPFIDFLLQVLGVVLIGLFNNIKGVVQGVITFILGVIQTFAAVLTGNWSKAWEGVKKIFSGAFTAIWNLVQLWIGGRIFGFFGQIVGKLVKPFQQVKTQALKTVASWATALYIYFRGIVIRLTGILTPIVKRGIQIFLNFKNGIVNTVKKINLVSIGRSIVSGLARGISAAKNMVLSAVNRVVSLIPGKIRKYLAIRSPSRVTMALGRLTSQGLELGLRKGAERVGSAADYVASKALMRLERVSQYEPAFRFNPVPYQQALNPQGSHNPTINMTNTFHINQELSPSDIAREQLNLQRRLALDWRG